MPSEKPWATGPSEILNHVFYLIRNDSDSNRRIAMILIDNAVEQMIKTYLNLPKRVVGFSIPRERRNRIAESFPEMIDALEEFASDKLDGVDVGMLEWHHRQRNQLYHEGFGLTVSLDSLNVYLELAKSLIKNLFSVGAVQFTVIEVQPVLQSTNLGQFIELWAYIEKGIVEQAMEFNTRRSPRAIINSIEAMAENGKLAGEEAGELLKLRSLRNNVVHGQPATEEITEALLKRMRYYAEKFR